MSDDKTAKSEFKSFLEDVAREITERVESIAPKRTTPLRAKVMSEDRRILDWPSVSDRMIDELR